MTVDINLHLHSSNSGFLLDVIAFSAIITTCTS